MNEPQAHIYEFGEFRVDRMKRLLLRGDGEIVPLTPKVFDSICGLRFAVFGLWKFQILNCRFQIPFHFVV